MEVSPYLSGIQSINGKTPSDKFKELYSIVTQIIKNEMEKNEFIKTGESHRVQPALLPYLRILVGNELKQSDAVIEALKSDDVMVIKQALSAKWFFNVSNTLINVDYFIDNIMPYVSVRTRLELIKKLARCLVNEPKTANDLFYCFSNLYNLEQVLPLIVACSEDYIFDTILQRRINLPSRLLDVLYRRYPNLVIRYLQLGNVKNRANIQDRKQHTISIADYDGFLPTLIKNHTYVYIELNMKNYLSRRPRMLGYIRATFFLKNATNVLITHPNIFLDRLPLKLVSRKLTTQQFETMYENLFPKNRHSYSLQIMFDYLKYYPEEKKVNLMREKYRKHYDQELLELKDIESFELYKLLPMDQKEKICRKLIEPYLNTDQYYSLVYWLPPKEAISLMKKQLSKSLSERGQCFETMIRSCAIYNRLDDLHDLLCYYNTYHENERAHVLSFFFSALTKMFNLGTLPSSHWKVLRKILYQAYLCADLFTALQDSYQIFFKQALHFHLRHYKTIGADKASRNFLKQLVDMVLEGYLEHRMQWEFISDCTEFERDCLQIFLAALPKKYPVDHDVWKNFQTKLNLVSYLVQAIHSFNLKNMHTVQSKNRYSKDLTITTDSEDNKVRYTEFAIKSYDWLVKLTTEVLKKYQATDKNSRAAYSALRRILKKHDAEFYESLIDNDPNLIYECQTSDAVVILKRNSEKILSKWELYLKKCKELAYGRSRSFESFIKALKWHQVIPIKFVEQCMNRIECKGSISILGILLEGEAFTTIMKPYLSTVLVALDPEDDIKELLSLMTTWLIKAMRSTNPPVTLDVFLQFCQSKYVSVASPILKNIGQRVPINRFLDFAIKLLYNEEVAVKKLGIRLVYQVASKIESMIFLANIWSIEKDASTRRMLVKMIFEIFQHSASEENWKMMKVCINSLTADDYRVLKSLNKINLVDKNFVENYTIELLTKFIQIPECTLSIKRSKSVFLKTFWSSVDESISHRLPEELLMDVVRINIFCKDNNFIIYHYLMDEESKFEKRLEHLINILKEKAKQMDKARGVLTMEYPIRSVFRQFFDDVSSILIQEINCNTAKQLELKVKIVDRILKFMTTSLKPIKQPYSYILMKMTKDLLESQTIEECGTRFVKTVKDVMKELGGEIIWSIIADAFVAVMSNSFDFALRELDPDMVLDVVEAMMKIDQQTGSMLGILALKRCQINECHEKYDLLIKTWKEMDNFMLQAFLNQFHIDLTN